MEIVRLEIEPQLAREPMAEPVACVCVQHHLGQASRSAGEVNNARLIAAGRLAVKVRRDLSHPCVKVRPACSLSPYEQAHTIEILHPGCSLAIRDDGAGVGGFDAIADVFRGEQRRAWNRHRPKFGQAEHRDPPLRHAREDHQHPITASYANRIEESSGPTQAFAE